MARSEDVPFNVPQANLVKELVERELSAVRKRMAQDRLAEERLIDILEMVDPWLEDK